MPVFNHPILNHRNLYLTGLAVILGSLPLSPFGVSLGTFIIAGNWILEGNPGTKLRMLKEQNGILLFASIYFIWIIGLWNTHNFEYALHDLKIKVPLLILPIVIGSTPALIRKEFMWLVQVFITSLWIAVIAGFMKKFGVLMPVATDSREMGLFISHIRLALMVGTGILLSIELLHVTGKKVIRLFCILSILIFTGFLLALHSLTGLFVVVMLLFVVSLHYLRQISNQMLQYFLSILIVTIFLLGLSWISNANRNFYTVEPVLLSDLDSLTVNGNPYTHILTSDDWENGHYTWVFLSEKELRQEWNRISDFKYDGKDKRGNEIRFTLIRYLTSKGLRKDSAGIHQLTPEDIHAIESGTANVLYTKPFSLYSLYYKWLWELKKYRETGDPSGHSLVQRLVYQKTGWQIAHDHFYTGVGTGDVQDVFNEYYENAKVPITEKWRLRAHNQYLTTLITVGVFGLIWFLIAFFLPWYKQRRHDLIVIGFLCLAAVSMLWEDTLETQAGVYFIVFFYVFLIFAWKPGKNKNADFARGNYGKRIFKKGH